MRASYRTLTLQGLQKPLLFVSILSNMLYARIAQLGKILQGIVHSPVFGNMIGRQGAGLPAKPAEMLLLAALLAWVWFMPNTQQVLSQVGPGDARVWSLFPNLRWRPSLMWGCVIFAAFLISLIYANASSTFLYFQF
jgi:hypothetical protein